MTCCDTKPASVMTADQTWSTSTRQKTVVQRCDNDDPTWRTSGMKQLCWDVMMTTWHDVRQPDMKQLCWVWRWPPDMTYYYKTPCNHQWPDMWTHFPVDWWWWWAMMEVSARDLWQCWQLCAGLGDQVYHTTASLLPLPPTQPLV